MAATAEPAPCATPHRHVNLKCCGRGHGPLLQVTDFFRESGAGFAQGGRLHVVHAGWASCVSPTLWGLLASAIRRLL